MREPGRGVYSFLLLFFSLKPRPSLCGPQSEGVRQGKTFFFIIVIFCLLFFSSLLKFLRLRTLQDGRVLPFVHTWRCLSFAHRVGLWTSLGVEPLREINAAGTTRAAVASLQHQSSPGADKRPILPVQEALDTKCIADGRDLTCR